MSGQNYVVNTEVGQSAPDFTAVDVDGNRVNLRSLLGGGKTLLVFYRGGWCPMCNKQLASFAQDQLKFRELSTKIVAVSGEEIEKGKELISKHNLSYVLLSDPTFEAIDRYGVRSEKRDMLAKMKRIKSYATPSVFIIDEQGVIRYKYVGKDAHDRPKNDELLERLREIV